MNVLDFNIKAGWPGSTETWEYLQNMVLQAQQAALLGGNNYIVSGCAEVGGLVGNGIVVVNGELCPFEGGPLQASVVVVDIAINREFFGGEINTYYHQRKAVFGSGGAAVAWSAFKRNTPDNGVLARLDKMERMLKPLMGYEVAGQTVYGSWLFWGRAANEIPAGWEAVPDAEWKGKMPVVLDESQVEFNTIGGVGGSKSHTVTKNNIQEFTISKPGSSGTGGIGNPVAGSSSDDGNVDYKVGVPNPTPINHLSPYKVVLFIRFIG